VTRSILHTIIGACIVFMVAMLIITFAAWDTFFPPHPFPETSAWCVTYVPPEPVASQWLLWDFIPLPMALIFAAGAIGLAACLYGKNHQRYPAVEQQSTKCPICGRPLP